MIFREINFTKKIFVKLISRKNLPDNIPHLDCAHYTPIILCVIWECHLHLDYHNACCLEAFVGDPAQSVKK